MCIHFGYRHSWDHDMSYVAPVLLQKPRKKIYGCWNVFHTTDYTHNSAKWAVLQYLFSLAGELWCLWAIRFAPLSSSPFPSCSSNLLSSHFLPLLPFLPFCPKECQHRGVRRTLDLLWPLALYLYCVSVDEAMLAATLISARVSGVRFFFLND